MQKIKKIMAGLGTALMAGATLAMPVFAGKTIGQTFNSMTPANTVVVVGENAAVSDVVAAIAVAAKLGQHGATASVSSGTAGAEVSGGVALYDANNKLYLGSPINNVKNSLTSKDLPNVLAKGTFEDDEGTDYDYNQYIEVGGNKITFNQMESDEDPVIAIQMSTSSSDPLYTYRVDFNKVVDVTKKDSSGRYVVIGNSIKLGGVDFTIGSESDANKLVLYKASDTITLHEGDEKTVTVGGNSYTIKVVGFDSDNDEVVLQVNGATDSVAEGHSRKIGGLEVYAKTVTSWNNGADGVAILQVGSEKVTLENNEPVKVGDDEDEIDGTNVVINGGSGDLTQLSSIEIQVFAPDSDNDYIAAGKEFTDPVFGSFKVKFDSVVPGLKDESRDKIAFKNDGDNKGYVEFKDKDGETRKLYWVYDNSGALSLRGSESDENIHVVEGEEVAKNEITMLAPGDPDYTHLVKVKKIDTDSENGYVEFEDVLTGETYKTKEGNFSTAGDSLDLIVDGKTYTVTLKDDTAGAEKISVEYASDSATVVYPTIKLNNGEEMAVTEPLSGVNIAVGTQVILPTGTLDYSKISAVNATDSVLVGNVYYDVYVDDLNGDGTADSGDVLKDIKLSNASAPAILLIEEENDKYNNEKEAVIVDAYDKDNQYITFNPPVFTDSNAVTGVGTSDSDVSAYLDTYGTYAEKDSSDNDHTLVTLWYPDNQMYARVAIGENPQFGAAAAGNANINFVPVSPSMAKLDSEVSSGDKSNYNLILVGGPAINSLVAELADAGKTLTLDQWRTNYVNKGIVQVVEDAFTSGKAALIVAGYEAQDTRNAAAKLLSGDLDDKEGAVIAGDTVEDLNLSQASGAEGNETSTNQ